MTLRRTTFAEKIVRTDEMALHAYRDSMRAGSFEPIGGPLGGPPEMAMRPPEPAPQVTEQAPKAAAAFTRTGLTAGPAAVPAVAGR
ncbi:hypothetical protein ACTFTM_21305 [Micromonospora sp. RB23]